MTMTMTCGATTPEATIITEELTRTSVMTTATTTISIIIMIMIIMTTTSTSDGLG